MGEIAQETAPTNSPHAVRLFSGVYANKYARHMADPSKAGSPPAAKYKYSAPASGSATPKISASRGRKVPLGRGRDAVPRTYPSDSRSMSRFSAAVTARTSLVP